MIFMNTVVVKITCSMGSVTDKHNLKEILNSYSADGVTPHYSSADVISCSILLQTRHLTCVRACVRACVVITNTVHDGAFRFST